MTKTIYERIYDHLEIFHSTSNIIENHTDDPDLEIEYLGGSSALIGNPCAKLLSLLRENQYFSNLNDQSIYDILITEYKTNPDFFIYQNPDDSIGLTKDINRFIDDSSPDDFYLNFSPRPMVFFTEKYYNFDNFKNRDFSELQIFIDLYKDQLDFPLYECMSFGFGAENQTYCNEFQNWLPILSNINPNSSVLGVNFNKDDPEYLKFGIAIDDEWGSCNIMSEITVLDIIKMKDCVNLRDFFNELSDKIWQ
jgi:hypothetical protein